MKRLFTLLLLAVVSACGTEPQETHSPIQTPDLEPTLDLFNQAFREGNLAVLDSLTTDDYIHTNGNSKAFGKASWFNYLKKRSEQIENGSLVITAYQLQEQETHLHGTSAVVTGKIVTTGTNQGEPFSNALRISNFWVLEDGTWKRAAFHDTRIE